MPYPNQPSNNLWVGNNYTGYPQNRAPMYNNPMPQYNMSQQQQQPPQIDNVINVMGVAGARNFAMGPNSRAILVDTENPIVFFKHSDDSGYSKLMAFKIEQIPLDSLGGLPAKENPTEPSLFVTKEDFHEAVHKLEHSIHELEEALTNA